MHKRKKKIIILVTVFFISAVSYQHVYANLSLNNSINASNSAGINSQLQQVALSSGQSGIVYLDGTTVFYDNSGTNFGSAIQQSNGTATFPEIAVSGTDSHIVWLQSGSLLYNNTSVPGSAKKLATGVASSATSNMLAVSGSDVHIVFRQSGVLKYINNTSSFSNAASPITINSGASNQNQQLAISGSTLHVIWQNSTGVFYNNNTNDFANSALSLGTGSIPQLAVSGTDVHFVWKDTSSAIKYASLTSSLSTPVTISNTTNITNNPKIAASGGNVYAVWQELVGANSEVFFASSLTGFNPVNLSNNSGASTDPQIAVSGTDVVVSWKDTSYGGAIYQRSSNDSGSTFGSFSVMSDVTNVATNPKLAISGSDVAASWQENISGSNDIIVRTGTINQNLIEFDKSEYTVSANPLVTYTIPSKAGDGTSGDVIAANVFSTTDTTGISVNLTESGNTGIFTRTFSLTSGASDDTSDTLQVSDGDVVTLSNSSESGSAFIIPVTLSLDSVNYDFGDIATITVDDASQNLNSTVIDTITVHVSTTTNSAGMDLALTETAVDSGVFTGKMAFMIGNGVYSVGGRASITTTALGYAGAGTITSMISSETTPGGITLTLTESGSSGVFTGTLNLSSSTTNASTGTIKVSSGDYLTFTEPDGLFVYKGMVQPNPSVSKGIIAVSLFGDTLSVDYGSLSGNANVLELSAPGGGAGGVSRTGFVVQALGAIAIFGGGSGIDSSGPPSFDSSSFVLNQDGQKLDVKPQAKSILKVGKASDISMGFVMPGGIGVLDHIGLYANIAPGQGKYDSDTYIYYDKYKDPQITMHDPHGFFKSVNLDVKETSRNHIEASFQLDFAKAMENGNAYFETWNNARESAQIELPGLLKMEGDAQSKVPAQDTQNIVKPQEKQRPPVPDWVKSNAGWWGEGQIDDGTFTNGIAFLIQKGIIDVKVDSTNISPDPTQTSPEQVFSPKVPDWVKNTALWWSQDQLTDDEFLNGIKYMVIKGIIQVRV